MKVLQPLTIIILGPILLGIIVTTITWFDPLSSRSLSKVMLSFCLGVTMGVALFGLIAVVSLFRECSSNWVSRHSGHIYWYTSILMAASAGYFYACMRYEIYDGWQWFALGLFLTCGVVKVELHYILKRRDTLSHTADIGDTSPSQLFDTSIENKA